MSKINAKYMMKKTIWGLQIIAISGLGLLGFTALPATSYAKVNAYVTGYQEPEPSAPEEIVAPPYYYQYQYSQPQPNYQAQPAPIIYGYNYYSSPSPAENPNSSATDNRVNSYNYERNAYNYESDPERDTSLTSSVILGSDTFLPSSIVQWVLLAIVLTFIIILVRRIFGAREQYDNTPLKHA